METKMESASRAQHPNLYLRCAGSNTGFIDSFNGAPVIKSPVFRGDDPAEDESVDEEDDDYDTVEDSPTSEEGEEDGRISKITEINTLQNRRKDSPPSMISTNNKKKPRKIIRFEDEEDSSRHSSNDNLETRHDVSSSSEDEQQKPHVTQYQPMENNRDVDNNNNTTSFSDDSETDLDGESEAEVERRTKSKPKNVTAAEYESSLTFAKTRRDVITRLHHLGYVKEPRIFLSHEDKLELDKLRGKGAGQKKRSESYGLGRLGSPPFVKKVPEGAYLKAPLMDKSVGRTSLVFKNNKVRPFTNKNLSANRDSSTADGETLEHQPGILSRIGQAIRKLFMQFQPFKRRPTRS